MLNKAQLEFIKGAITAKGAVVPTENNGAIARVFLSTLDEVDAQLRALGAVALDEPSK